MYSIIDENTGTVLAKDLTLDAVDSWLNRNGRRYVGVKHVGIKFFVKPKTKE
jgi:hypothetical protein